jgi:hypothetical protein
MPKLDFQWPAAVIFSVVFATLGLLVYCGKIHPEALFALLAVLVPAPYQSKPSAPQDKP